MRGIPQRRHRGAPLRSNKATEKLVGIAPITGGRDRAATAPTYSFRVRRDFPWDKGPRISPLVHAENPLVEPEGALLRDGSCFRLASPSSPMDARQLPTRTIEPC